jgi:farnesyl diphosphate synthase
MENIEKIVSNSNISISSCSLGLLVGFLSSTRNVIRSVESCRKFGVDVDLEAASFVAGLVFGTTSSKDKVIKSSSNEDDTKLSTRINDKTTFATAFDRVAAGILKSLSDAHSLGEEALAWVREMMYYTVPGGKMNRGVSVIDTLRIINGAPLDETQLEDAITLGWCIEFLQAFFLVADDVMDRSQTRRGKICWYRVSKVKEIAINDSFLLQSFVFDTIRRRFSGSRSSELVNLFLDVTLQTEIGQLYDLTSQPIDAKPDLKRFTIQRYRHIVKYKTAFYSFYLPVACGMILGNVNRGHDFDVARDICCAMGEYFQIQDDFLDCYGDPKVIGKVGTDIQDNKCSWLVVQALERSSKSQQKVLIEHYGKDQENSIKKIKALYKSLELEKHYLNYENESYKKITSMIETTKAVPHGVFQSFLNKIYKRNK